MRAIEPHPRDLVAQADWVRRETLKLHRRSPETRIASSLSCVEILTALFYGDVLAFDAKRPLWDARDRFIASKGHGTISCYPILADLGFIAREELERISREDCVLKVIPDPAIPGYETINGSLGHGPGVGCGMALALRNARRPQRVFVLVGDGELFEGSVWEAVMFAGHHGLENLVLVVDANGGCMLDFCRNVIDLAPLEAKFAAFGWEASVVDGHDVVQVAQALRSAKASGGGKPRVVVARTVKGKGVESLEKDPLSHVRMLTPEQVDAILAERP